MKETNNNQMQPNIKRGAVMMALMLGSFLALLNETILNVAFSTLMTEMHITAGTVQWLATGYMLIIGISIPVTAFLIHTYTTRKLYLVAMGLFFTGTLLAGFSSTFPGLLAARIIHNIFLSAKIQNYKRSNDYLYYGL